MLGYQEFVNHLLEQFQQKNLAYGNSVHRSYCRYGMTSYAVRLSDKFSRLETLMANRDIPHADESLADTIGDAATYAILASADMVIDEIDPPNGKANPDSTLNHEKALDSLLILTEISQDECAMMAQLFMENWMEESDSLVDAVYTMYTSPDTTPVDFTLLAMYCVNYYMEKIWHD